MLLRTRFNPAVVLLPAWLAALALSSRPAPAAVGGMAASQPEPAGVEVSGRDFGGVRLPESEQSGEVRLSASRGYLWTERSAEGRATQRLLLEGDVRVLAGVYRFGAARAVAWIETVPSPSEAGRSAYQVAVYFDRVDDPGAAAGVSQAADRLLVTGVLSGPVRLRTDATTRGRPADAFLREAERRLAAHLVSLGARAVSAAPVQEQMAPVEFPAPARAAVQPGLSRPYEPGSPLGSGPPADSGREEPYLRFPPIFADRGLITFATNSDDPIRLIRQDDENALVITGGVIVQHTDTRANRTLQITAERAVVFLAPGPLSQVGRHGAEDVRGIYLEGAVIATDGQYTLRGPRVFYDVPSNSALIADAVFWTYDEQRRLPLYVRAESIRQLSSNRFSAKGARLSNAAFFEPHFSIGSSDITVTRSRQGDGTSTTFVDASNMTLEVLGVPVFYWPRFKGDIERIPLRDARVENSSGSGTAIKTTWDLGSLTGVELPEGVDADLLLDGYFDRGVGLGLDASWNRDRMEGDLLVYGLPHDTGRDQLTSGARIRRDGEFRGLVLGEHRWLLDDEWTLQLEGAHVSDENFLDAFFEPIAETGRELSNVAYLRRLDDTSSLTFLAKGSFMDFAPNEYLLQSQGYTTEKLPEVAYYRVLDDLLRDTAPGLLTYASEYRYSRIGLNFTQPTLAELGFDTPRRADAAFGLAPTDTLADRLRLIGYEEAEINRFDTRHELSLTFNAGPVKVNPFVTGRLTAYDRDFTEFSPDSDDQLRLWGAAGMRLSTSMVRVDDDVESRLFDLHRIRHVIEPSVTLWSAGTNVDQNDLPVYDDRVESLASTSAVRVGVDQTWQTKRGGPGRWQNVDVLRINQHFVFASGDSDRESPIGRFFDFRPEYSQLGDHSTTDIMWQASDAVALSFHTTYDLERHQPARTSVGAVLRHWEDFDAWAEARYINARDATFVTFGTDYRLTRKYALSAHATYDTDLSEFQSIGGTLRRRTPSATLGVVFNYNEITDETSFGVVFEPVGLPEDRSLRLQQLGPRQRGRTAAIGG